MGLEGALWEMVRRQKSCKQLDTVRLSLLHIFSREAQLCSARESQSMTGLASCLLSRCG